MRIQQIRLRNFGLYRGEQVFDLGTRTKRGRARPIVLVGGHNGAGKTTILDAIRLCLYGRLALGSRVTEAEYNEYLRERIHRGPDVLIPVQYASVALEFEYAHSGRRSDYVVQRAWEARGAHGVTESLRVLRNGEPLADVEAQFWPEFIRSLVPAGVSQLFFFDGEKIKRLAEDDTEAATLAESIKALLGLDLVEQLQADLDLYSARYLKKTATGATLKKLSELEASEHTIVQALEQLKLDHEKADAEIRALGEDLSRKEQTLAMRGEGLSARRGEQQQDKAQLLAKQELLEKALRELCEGPLPFALCPGLSQELIEQLALDERQEHSSASRVEVARVLKLATSALTRGAFPKRFKWDAKTRKAVVKELNNVLASSTTTDGAPDVSLPVHGMSPREREQARQTLAAALGDIPRRTSDLSNDLHSVVSELRKVQDRLNRAPESDEIAPVVKELSALQERQASLTLDRTIKNQERERLERELGAVHRERGRILDMQEKTNQVADRLKRAKATRLCLETYLSRLTAAKVAQLELAALECLKQLGRKTEFVEKLTIDPTTYNVSLYDGANRPIPKSSLSAGEKQIYAISLLWALAKVSGRPLPMIIDTPLGRLDSVHRQRLLERYFPFASHQVIILSTDTEVDQQYFETLRPHTSHAVHLVNHSGWTEVEPGYFWKPEVRDAGTAA